MLHGAAERLVRILSYVSAREQAEMEKFAALAAADAKAAELAADKKGKLSESERALTRNMDKRAWSGAPLLTSITGSPVRMMICRSLSFPFC